MLPIRLYDIFGWQVPRRMFFDPHPERFLPELKGFERFGCASLLVIAIVVLLCIAGGLGALVLWCVYEALHG